MSEGEVYEHKWDPGIADDTGLTGVKFEFDEEGFLIATATFDSPGDALTAIRAFTLAGWIVEPLNPVRRSAEKKVRAWKYGRSVSL